MNKRSRSQWQALFSAHQQSGLSQSQFCKQHKLCPKYFSLRRKQLNGEPTKATTASPLIRLQRPAAEPPSSVVSLHYQGVTLRFGSADARVIVDVVKQLAC